MKKSSSYTRDHKLPDNMGYKSDPTSRANIDSVGGQTCSNPKADYAETTERDSVTVSSYKRKVRGS